MFGVGKHGTREFPEIADRADDASANCDDDCSGWWIEYMCSMSRGQQVEPLSTSIYSRGAVKDTLVEPQHVKSTPLRQLWRTSRPIHLRSLMYQMHPQLLSPSSLWVELHAVSCDFQFQHRRWVGTLRTTAQHPGSVCSRFRLWQ